MLGAVTAAAPQVPSSDGLGALQQRQSAAEQGKAVVDFLRQRIDKASEDRSGVLARPQPTLEPRRMGRQFEALPSLDRVRVSIIDQKEDKVVREIPSAKQIQFLEKFRQFLIDSVGQHVDVSA